jgi:hypothetical protein
LEISKTNGCIIHRIKTFFQCFSPPKLPPMDSFNTECRVDVLVGFAFGERCNSLDSNADLALVANEIALPTIAQGEIAYYLEDFPDTECISLANSFPNIDYVDSRHIAQKAFEICKEYGWTRVGVLAHPDHQWRCCMTLKKLGIHAYPVDCSRVKYSPKNNQPWVRAAWRLKEDWNPLNSFIPREIIARIYFLFKG